MREFTADDRAVSTTVGYALTLGIASLLVTGLLIAGGGFLQDQRERSARTELTVIGHQVAADIASADRLTDSAVTDIRVSRDLPERVTGSSYTIEVVNSEPTYLVLRSAEPEVTVRIDFEAQFVSGVDGSVSGGDIRIEYRSGSDTLVVESA